jgi:hypothetical protein
MTVVTCGDAAAGQLRAAGLGSDVLVWRDILHEGPVPGGLRPDELAEVRAGYLAAMGWTTREAALHDQHRRDERLAAATDRPIELWFDDNLVNQLQLLQVLSMLATLDPKEVWLAGPHTFGGAPASELRELAEARRPVTQAHFDTATAAWVAFTSADPTGLAGAGGPALPALGPALLRFQRQYPSTRGGLGQTERAALAAVAAGHPGFTDIFLAQAEHDEPKFMGDTTFRHYLDRLTEGPHPLLRTDSAGRYHLTGSGQRVLAGDTDQVELNGIDRWYGGVHLTGRAPWRWDEREARIIRTEEPLV